MYAVFEFEDGIAVNRKKKEVYWAHDKELSRLEKVKLEVKFLKNISYNAHS